jgi:hypothetical protein
VHLQKKNFHVDNKKRYNVGYTVNIGVNLKFSKTILPKLTLSYSLRINGYLYYQRVSPPLKKNALICYQRANAPQPVGCDSPLLIVMVVWRPFCLNSNFLGRV